MRIIWHKAGYVGQRFFQEGFHAKGAKERRSAKIQRLPEGPIINHKIGQISTSEIRKRYARLCTPLRAPSLLRDLRAKFFLPQPIQRCLQTFRLGSFFGVVGTGFFDGFGFGLFDKGGVGEAARERIAFLGGGFDGFGDAGAFGV